MHPFSESIKTQPLGESANYGNIVARRKDRENIERDINAFIESGGKIDVVASNFDNATPNTRADFGSVMAV